MRRFIALAAPLAIAQVGTHAMGLVDTLMAGRLGEQSMAALGLGNALFFLLLVAGNGMLAGLDTLISRDLGAGDPTRAERLLHTGRRFALGLGGALALITLGLHAVMGWMGIEPELRAAAYSYLLTRAPGYVLLLLFFAARSYLQCHGRTRAILVASLVGNLANAALDWILVEAVRPYVSAADATMGLGASSTLTAGVMLLVLHRELERTRPLAGSAFRPATRPAWREVLALGLPTSLQMVAEVGFFSLVAVLATRAGAATGATHQALMSVVSILFTVAVAFSRATTVLVAHQLGRGHGRDARLIGVMGMATICGLMLVAAGGLGVWIHFVAPKGLLPAGVLELLEQLAVVAVAFLVVDALQVVAAGALRGLGDARTPFVITVIAHYGAATPLLLGWALDHSEPLAAIWTVMTLCLTGSAVAMSLLFLRSTSSPSIPGIAR